MSSLVNAAPNLKGSTLSLSAEVSLVRPLAAARAEIVRLRKQVNQLEQQLNTDELTGIPNRCALYAHAQQLSDPAIVAIVDLNQFKPINDQYGHHTGDAILYIVAQRLKAALTQHGLAARLGGDEFALIIDRGYPHKNIVDTTQQLLTIIARELDTPLKTADRTFTISTSIGAAAMSKNEPFAHALHHADIAMYRAKYSGGGIAFYDPTVDTEATQISTRPQLRARDLPSLVPQLRD